MSNSTKAKLRRTNRKHLTKHQRGMVANQHFENRLAKKDDGIRGRGDKKLEKLIKEV